MRRKIVNKAKKISCNICNKLYSLHGISSHIRHVHKTLINTYVQTYGEFRKDKSRKSNRTIIKIKCKICNNKYSIVGIHNHLRDTHFLTVDQYIQQHGEYRKKYIDYNKRAKQNSVKCLLCDFDAASERHLSFHIRIEHKLNKMDYIKKHVFNNVPQLCQCGCKKEVTYIRYERPYKREFIDGHNSIGENNARYGVTVTEATRTKQRIAATKRLERNGTMISYNPNSIQYIEQLSKKHNWKLQHAENGGEILIKELGYYTDGYDKENNIVCEFYERFHYKLDGSLKKRDIKREQQIIKHLKCTFVRIHAFDKSVTFEYL